MYFREVVYELGPRGFGLGLGVTKVANREEIIMRGWEYFGVVGVGQVSNLNWLVL